MFPYLRAVKPVPYYQSKEKSKQNHSEAATTSADSGSLSAVRARPTPSVFSHFRGTFSTADMYIYKSVFIYKELVFLATKN